MPQKPEDDELVDFEYIVRRLDATDMKSRYVHPTAQLIAGKNADDARTRLIGRLAKEGVYDPDDPKVKVVVRPFDRATHQK